MQSENFKGKRVKCLTYGTWHGSRRSSSRSSRRREIEEPCCVSVAINQDFYRNPIGNRKHANRYHCCYIYEASNCRKGGSRSLSPTAMIVCPPHDSPIKEDEEESRRGENTKQKADIVKLSCECPFIGVPIQVQ